MTTLSVAFLWHMHQPYYTDMVQGYSILPWVRLHALKGYLDMAEAVNMSPGAKVTMNLTPVLVKQLSEQAGGHVKDDFLAISEKPVEDLTPEERSFVLRYFFMADWETMIRPFGEYLRLLHKRGIKGAIDFDQVQRKFTDSEIRDLVVWFNLAWFGWAALDKYPELLELKKKGEDFSEEDKKLVLDRQSEVMAGIIPLYRRLWDEGKIEVSTTPMYHPILPLLFDSVLADRAHPGVKLPNRYRHPEDAAAHVTMGMDYLEEAMGRRPAGMWPSEGSVAPELTDVFIGSGLRWIATDEGLLFKRVRAQRRDECLFHPWKVHGQDGRELFVFFRDHGLSDLIGFTYSRQPGASAADDLAMRLREIRSSISRLGQDHAVASVILDGENAWQSYPDGGREFLSRLYEQVSSSEGLELVTFSEYLDRHPPSRDMDRLSTGSWINNNFDIWIGGPEENKAWDYLGRVRDDLPRISEDAPEGVKKGAWESLYAAEGSDWFWWYGDQFHSDLDQEFDHLFRVHLKNVYLVLGKEPPLFLNEPVIFEHPVRVMEEPMDLLDPLIDGKVSDYYEWRAAGHVELSSQGAMYQGMRRLGHIYYGFDLENFFLRLDPCPEQNDTETLDVRVHLLAPLRRVVAFPFHDPKVAAVYEEAEDGSLIPLGEIESVAARKIIELKAPFDLLGLKPNNEVQFVVKLYEGPLEIERHPHDGFISFSVPDESFEARHWSV